MRRKDLVDVVGRRSPARSVVGEPRISIVICTMPSRREDLLGCLGSLRRAEGCAEAEVLVVGREGDDLSRLEEVGLAVRRVFARTRGAADKRNRGVAAARGEFVAYLDDDATVRADWLPALLGALAGGADAVAGAVEPAFDTAIPAELAPVVFHIGGFNRLGGVEQRGSFLSANCAFRREFLLSLGPFDTRLGPGSTWLPWGEDSEMFVRAVLRGRVAFAAGATVRHRIQRERISAGYVLRRAFAGGRTLCAINRLHSRSFVRHALPVPLYFARMAVGAARAPRDLECRVRRNRFAGYFFEAARLLLAGMPPP